VATTLPTPSRPRALASRLGETAVAVPLIAGLILAEALREIWFGPVTDAQVHTQLSLLALAQAAGTITVRRAPLVGIALACSGPLVASTFTSLWDRAPIIGLGVIPACYLLGRWTAGRRQQAGVALGAVLSIAAIIAEHHFGRLGADLTAGSLVSRLAFTFAMVWVGVVVRDRATLHAALRARAERHESERVRTRERTVAEERARIAGELHDVIAHALSAIVVQAGAARQLARVDAPAATSALAAIETTGRGAMHEIRSMLSVLRAPDEPDTSIAGPSPRPGIALLPSLVSDAAPSVAFRVSGVARPVPASVDLTVYRVAQEAVRLATRAGAAEVTITLTYDRAAVTITIVDDGASERPALLSRERVGLYRGECAAAPTSDGYVVRARLSAEPSTAGPTVPGARRSEGPTTGVVGAAEPVSLVGAAASDAPGQDRR
jgi:signal transduction histidine kinase